MRLTIDTEIMVISTKRRCEARQWNKISGRMIQVAENDILSDEGEAYGRKLEQAGVEVLSVRYNGVIHDFGMLNGLAGTPQVKGLIELAAAELKKHL